MPILTPDDFISKLRIQSYRLALTDNLIQSRSIGGTILASSSGPRLWTGTITCSRIPIGQGITESLISSIANPDTFFDFIPRNPELLPQTLMGIASVTCRIVSPVAGYNVTFSGIPDGLTITEGDYFSYTVSGISFIHQIMETKTGTSGNVSFRMLNPFLATRMPANNTIVSFVNPKVTCRLVPKSWNAGMVGLSSTDGASFDFIQAMNV